MARNRALYTHLGVVTAVCDLDAEADAAWLRRGQSVLRHEHGQVYSLGVRDTAGRFWIAAVVDLEDCSPDLQALPRVRR